MIVSVKVDLLILKSLSAGLFQSYDCCESLISLEVNKSFTLVTARSTISNQDKQ